MKPGTPGFVGERLKSAREARGLSAASLSSLIGVSRAAVSQYEKGDQSPSPRVMRLIAEKLNLPAHHFLRPIAAEQSIVFYRSLSTATKAARVKAEQRYAWLREIVVFLGKYIRIPAANLPTIGATTDRPEGIDVISLEEIAQQVREYWGLSEGPVSHTIRTFERNGIIVARNELDSEKLDAFSEWRHGDRSPFVILNSEKHSAVRSRFDAAHELAHILLHKDVSQNTLNTPTTFRLMEDQANRFAGAFLLPESLFVRDLHSISLDCLRALKPKWRVSIGVMIKRISHLGLVSESEEQRLWINYARRGWRRREPLDDELIPEEPAYLRRCLELLVEKGILPRHDFSFLLALPPGDISELLGIPVEFFDDQGPQVELRNLARPVIPFPSPLDD